MDEHFPALCFDAVRLFFHCCGIQPCSRAAAETRAHDYQKRSCEK